MRALIDVTPTAEQLSLFSRINTGVEVIRGAAGSGKTTTALLKLRSSIGSFVNRKKRTADKTPLKILLLTYNRTLSGYVSELASKQFAAEAGIELEISTFDRWAREALGRPDMISKTDRKQLISELAGTSNLGQSFIEEEVNYLIGRFLPGSLNQYVDVRRVGRGPVPRMEKPVREGLLHNIVTPYLAAVKAKNLCEWNDLAVDLAVNHYFEYDIVIVDEAQDFSANQIRAVMNQLAATHAVTFVLDTAQRIYATGYTWQEVGITIRPENSFRLSRNYRNTQEIARFAASVVAGVDTDDDGTLPNFNNATRSGNKPIVLAGRYKNQVAYAIDYIHRSIDLRSESVAFLHPKGGGWFDYLRSQLISNQLSFVEISREAEWPQGSENIALSTLHSSKGLEFDHVIILGLNSEILVHGDDLEDDKLITLRRLLAMGIGRAKNSVIVGYSKDDRPSLINYFDINTFDEISL